MRSSVLAAAIPAQCTHDIYYAIARIVVVVAAVVAADDDDVVDGHDDVGIAGVVAA